MSMRSALVALNISMSSSFVGPFIPLADLTVTGGGLFRGSVDSSLVLEEEQRIGLDTVSSKGSKGLGSA